MHVTLSLNHRNMKLKIILGLIYAVFSTILVNAQRGQVDGSEWDDGNSIIAGETNQFYNPTTTGNYAVEITQNSCVDTSVCYLIDLIGLSGLCTEMISVHPNPTQDILIIDGIQEIIGFKSIEIISSIGELVMKFETVEEEIDVSELPSAVYFLNIIHTKGAESIRFVKHY